MPQIGRLWTDLELESSQFTVGLRKAVAESAAASSKIQKTLGAIRTGLVAGAGAIAGMGLVSAAREALDYASSLGEVASQLGVTTRDLQEYRYVATQVGVSQETMDKSLAKLTVTMGQAREGSKAQAAAFRELNSLIGKDILASAQGAGDAIPLISEALGKIEDPTRRARLEVALFGRAGQQLDPLLRDGAAGVNNLRDAAHSLGVVLSERQIQDADDTADKLSSLNTALSANIASAVASNAREIYNLVDSLTRLAAQIPNTIRAMLDLKDRALQEAGQDMMTLGALTMQPGMVRDGAAIAAAAGDRRNSRKGAAAQSAVDAKMELAGLSYEKRGGGGRRILTPGTGTPAAAKGRTPRGGGGGESAAEKAERARVWYEEQITRSKIDELAVQDQIVESASSRYALAIGRIDADRKSFAQDLKEREGLTAAQRAELTAANESVLQKELELADQEKYRAEAREGYELFAAANDAQQETVRAQIDTARTAGERRDAELRLLELQKQAEKAQLELVLATESTASAAADNARRRLEGLDGIYGARAAGVRRDTMGPLEAYRDSLPKTAAEVGEAYEQIAVRGIERMNDALGDSIKRTLGLKGAVGDLISEILVLEAKRMLFSGSGGFLSAIGKLVGVASGGGFDAAAVDAGAASAADSLARNLPRFATGGSMPVGGRSGIDRNVLSINGRPRALVSASERIHVTPDKLRAANDSTVQVVPSPYFDVVVDGRVVNGVGQAAPALVGASAGVTQSKAQYRAGRRLA